ncbi:hypothetical protein Tco_0624600, partial [Tanacetum coccineum]
VHKLLSRVLRNIIVIFARTFRVILFSIHNDEWKSFQCHHQTALRSSYWRLYESYGAYILELKDGTVIHMLVERRYPFSKDLLQRMLDIGLEVERESTAALDLIRFIKQQIDEN